MKTEDFFADRRVFPRLHISLYFEYWARLRGSDDSMSNQAILKNISMGGLHFLSEPPLPLKPGDIADFVFKFQYSDSNPDISNELRAMGLVKRIEPPDEESAHVGIVVEFLSGPIFLHAD